MSFGLARIVEIYKIYWQTHNLCLLPFCRKSKLLKHVLAIYSKIEASIELPTLLLEPPAKQQISVRDAIICSVITKASFNVFKYRCLQVARIFNSGQRRRSQKTSPQTNGLTATRARLARLKLWVRLPVAARGEGDAPRPRRPGETAPSDTKDDEATPLHHGKQRPVGAHHRALPGA